MDKIALAKANGDESIETTPEIISHYNRGGLNGAKFFIYSGIKVFPVGEQESIEAEMDEPVANKIHGKDELQVMGR